MLNRDSLTSVSLSDELRIGSSSTLNLEHTGAERRRVREVLNRDSLTSVSLSRPIFTASIGQWREHLVEEEVTRIVEALGPMASKLGQEWA